MVVGGGSGSRWQVLVTAADKRWYWRQQMAAGDNYSGWQVIVTETGERWNHCSRWQVLRSGSCRKWSVMETAAYGSWWYLQQMAGDGKGSRWQLMFEQSIYVETRRTNCPAMHCANIKSMNGTKAHWSIVQKQNHERRWRSLWQCADQEMQAARVSAEAVCQK